MTRAVAGVFAVLLLALPAGLVHRWMGAADERLQQAEAEASQTEPEVAVASAANEGYCTGDLKKILRRVLQSCGLIQGGTGRGCKPLEVKNVATMGGDDFNALFVPMKGRGGIVQYDKESDLLDPEGARLVDEVFSDRKGGSYFFVVARASPEGSAAFNRELSRARAEAVMTHLESTFEDSGIEREVGLLWLGEEYAQLDPSFCEWPRSGEDGKCAPEDLNRSAFLTWVDCTL